MTPLVSVVMSVHNNGADLARAMRTLLNQTFRDFELIVVDDGSTDASGRILEDHAAGDQRIKVLYQRNSGLGPALHRAIGVASGTFLARHDADDVSKTTRLASQVAYLNAHPEVVLCGTWSEFVDLDNSVLYRHEPPDDDRLLKRMLRSGNNPFVHGSIMMRKIAYDREGAGYRFTSRVQDYDLWLRLAAYGRLGMVQSVEYRYWLARGGISFEERARRDGARRLALRLDTERREAGREITDWRMEERRIRARHAIERPEARATAAAYARAIYCLRMGDLSSYRAHMRLALAGDGGFAAKARLHCRLQWLAPLVRQAYRARHRCGSGRYSRPIGKWSDIDW